VKQEVNGTVILHPLVFPGLIFAVGALPVVPDSLSFVSIGTLLKGKT